MAPGRFEVMSVTTRSMARSSLLSQGRGC